MMPNAHFLIKTYSDCSHRVLMHSFLMQTKLSYDNILKSWQGLEKYQRNCRVKAEMTKV